MINDLDRSVLTLCTAIRLQAEEVNKREKHDVIFMNLENAYDFDGTENYTLLQRPQYSPFKEWDNN